MVEVTRDSLVGRYRLIERIGSGGMAEVWRAVAEGPAGFEKIVALKRIQPQFAEDSEFARMLIAEAKMGAELDHPNIVEIFDLGYDTGTYFIVMQYVRGVDLYTLLARRRAEGHRLSPPVTAFVGIEVLRALEAAHGRKNAAGVSAPLIHRDVSPQNILVSTAGVVKLADFGVARALDQVRLTRPGVLKGKLGYMSPEYAAGRADIDGRSDVFSLGVVLWETLAGKRLFRVESDAATIEAVRRAEVPPLAEAVPGIPAPLATAIEKALERDRDDRHPDAAAFRVALQTYARLIRPAIDPLLIADLVREAMAVPGARPHEEIGSDPTEVQDEASNLGVLWSEAPSKVPEDKLHERPTQALPATTGKIESPARPTELRPAEVAIRTAPPQREPHAPRPSAPALVVEASARRMLGRRHRRPRPSMIALAVLLPVVTGVLSALLVLYRPVRARLRIEGAPGGTRVFVDDLPAVPGTDGSIVVQPGRRRVQVYLPGGRAEQREIAVPRGGEVLLVVGQTGP